jgi:hypothetical protein
VIESPYRETVRPVLRYVRHLRREHPGDVISVIIPEYVVGHWWQHVLHNQTALRLKGRLLFEPAVTVTSVPWLLGSHDGVGDLGMFAPRRRNDATGVTMPQGLAASSAARER